MPAVQALPEGALDLVLDGAVLLLQVLVRGMREHADGRALELGADDLVEVVGPDLRIEHVKLGDDRPVHDGNRHVEREPLGGEGVDVLLRGGEGDVEVVNARALVARLPEGARGAVPAGLQHLVLDPSAPRVEVEGAMARLNRGAGAARSDGERAEGQERETYR